MQIQVQILYSMDMADVPLRVIEYLQGSLCDLTCD